MLSAIKLLLLMFVTCCTPREDTPKHERTPVSDRHDTRQSKWSKLRADDLLTISGVSLREQAGIKADSSVVLLLPMSGTHRDMGRNILNACMLGNSNPNIDFYVLDTADYRENKNSFRNLKAVIGPVFFNEIHKFSSMFQDVPIFSLSNNITANDTHVCACGLSPQEEIEAVFKYMKKRGIGSIVILMPRESIFSNILDIIQKEAVNFSLDEDNVNVIRYEKIASEDLRQFTKGNEKKAVFLFEPLFKEPSETNLFTLSSIALSNPEKWEGVMFAYADNDEQRDFIEAYKMTFDEVPSVISLAAYDIIKAICESENKPIFDEIHQGTLGDFRIRRDKGIVRNLEIMRIENGEKTRVESPNA